MNLTNKILTSLFVFITINFKIIIAGRLLVIFSIPFPDNQITFRPLIENLLDKGHSITLVTTNPEVFLNNKTDVSASYFENNNNNNLEIIDLSFTHNLEILNQLKTSHQQNDLNGSDMIRDAFQILRIIAEKQLKSLEVEQFIGNNTIIKQTTRTSNLNNLNNNNNIKYDAVLIDWSGASLMNGFAYKFNAPLIGITPAGAYMTLHEAMGNPNHPVLYPSVFMPFSENLSLYQRIVSTLFSYKYRNIYFYEELPVQNQIAKEVFGSEIPDLWELQVNADLLLINSYQLLSNIRPVGPTTIYLGGIHAQNSKQKISNELEEFILKSDNDIAYINLGEPITMVFLNTNRIQKLLSTLEISHFNVIWNLNGHLVTNFNSTENIYMDGFMSQEDVLAYPKVKLFITIGGQRDIEDAIHHQVPCLGLTFSSTIDHYLLQIEKHGAGSISYFDQDTTTELLAKIEEFAIKDRFSSNIKKLHNLINDQPLSSVERAVWYIEYVMRNGGTKYQKTTWRNISWFNFLLIYVVLAIIVTIITFVGVLVKVFIECRKYSKSLPVEKITKRTLLAKEKLY
ncbi:UDP-glucosyltransferase 2-like [Condylostylus longicornis]|uniref:UDP-glucosyltransferase 2-like n=1 Tax=Condylostylus longicornis TaxID=2530218 RepID=UPI00244DD296|nr:UDP-glucosyltransferase 2-like [Condylostylus longicornis]